MVLTDSFTYLFTLQPTAEGLVVPENSSACGDAGRFSRIEALVDPGSESGSAWTAGGQLRTWTCFLYSLFLFLENEPGVVTKLTRRSGLQRGSRYAFSCRFRRGWCKVAHLRTCP